MLSALPVLHQRWVGIRWIDLLTGVELQSRHDTLYIPIGCKQILHALVIVKVNVDGFIKGNSAKLL